MCSTAWAGVLDLCGLLRRALSHKGIQIAGGDTEMTWDNQRVGASYKAGCWCRTGVAGHLDPTDTGTNKPFTIS